MVRSHCNNGEISSSVGLIITIIDTVAGGEGGGLWCGYCADLGCSASVGVYVLLWLSYAGFQLVVSLHQCQRRWALAIGGCGKEKQEKLCVLVRVGW